MSSEPERDEPNIIDSLRQRFRYLRWKNKLTQTEVAKLIGVRQPTISNFEKGKNDRVRRDNLENIRSLVADWEQDEKILPFVSKSNKSDSTNRESRSGTGSQSSDADQRHQHDNVSKIVERLVERLATGCDWEEVDDSLRRLATSKLIDLFGMTED